MASKNRKCLSCQEKYAYCPSCSRSDALEPSWKSEFCSEACMTLWSTLTKYNMDFMSKDEAKEIISGLNLKPIHTYADCVQRDYAKVMKDEKNPYKAQKKIEPIIDEVIEPIIEESHEVVTIENE